MLTVLTGDALGRLTEIESESVQCCVTSPPYWGLRDYREAGQIGLERSPEGYVERLVGVFREVRRVLKRDGTLWLNLGDSYNAYNGGAGPSSKLSRGAQTAERPKLETGFGLRDKSLKPKDLVGIPWMVAFALRSDGWWLRQDIIWKKDNPMPESVRDRCTKSHEYLFLLSKSARYYFDQESILEPVSYGTVLRMDQPGLEEQHGSDRVPGKTNGPMKPRVRVPDYYKGSVPGRKDGPGQDRRGEGERVSRSGNKERKPASARGVPIDTEGNTNGAVAGSIAWEGCTRNKRSVWSVTTVPFSEAHFATYPPDLIKPCIMAGSRPGDTVLDPFAGSGTTGMVALELGRRALLIELNPEYVKMIHGRCDVTPGLGV